MPEHPQTVTSGEIPYGAMRFSHHAMATLFEVFVFHDDAGYAEQAAFAAFHELDRLEQELSRFIGNSDISRINTAPADQAVRIGLDVFACLKQSLLLSEQTGHAFDVTADSGKRVRIPSFKLDGNRMTVMRLSGSVQIDLGGIGKGYAVDRMADVLHEWEIESVLIHGGTSSALACSAPPGEEGWKVTVSRPDMEGEILAALCLENQALSGSGVQKGPHVIDPRTGMPVQNTRAAWALAREGAASDALSTAFMVMNVREIEAFCSKNPEAGAMVLMSEPDAELIKYGDCHGCHRSERWHP
jgi:thiamine biosynthesis lipoprotein